MKTKEYIRPMPATWWLHNRHLVLFMIRELTSLFVAAYALFLLYLLAQVNLAGDNLQEFDRRVIQLLKNPGIIALHAVILIFVLYHCITWFNLTPKAVVLWQGEERVSPYLIAGAHYALWLIVSALILIYVLS